MTGRARSLLLSVLILAGALLAGVGLLEGCGAGTAPALSAANDDATTPAADPIGERLFLDTRFAKFFFLHMVSINQPLAAGDPVVATVNTPGGTQAGPFAGQSINCRSCHFVTEFQGVAGAGNRTYADFNPRSTIPTAQAGFTETPRNAMAMVGSFRQDGGTQFLHFDGEFASGEDLVIGTLTGRNFGWSPAEYATAVHHIAQVVRGDDGSGSLAQDRTNGLSYSVLFQGQDARIPASLLLPASQRMNVATATDEQIVQEVALCMAQYMRDLQFQHDKYGRNIGSPYDLFLSRNHLPMQPLAGETVAAYNARLLGELNALSNPAWVTSADGSFAYHAQTYQFGPTELAGLKIFLSSASLDAAPGAHAGNCAACHQAPAFTDFVFHNTGISQEEYESVHGAGSFAALHIPGLAERSANPDVWLPVSAAHPNAAEPFRRAATAPHPEWADLGMWNVYENEDIPGPQAHLAAFVCAAGKDCSIDAGLGSTIAQFKTPALRDLADSAPYFHNGSRAEIADAVRFYIRASALAKTGQLRNGDVQLRHMSLDESDISALTAFLQSLTEDYNDD